MSSAVMFAVALPTLMVAHNVGDHWVQSDHQAQTKAHPGWAGRWSCTKHVLTLTLTKIVFLSAVFGILGLGLPLAWMVLALAIDAASHYWADRRTTLEGLARLLDPINGKSGFYQLGQGQGHIGTGAYALDQAWHQAWLVVAAAIIAVGG